MPDFNDQASALEELSREVALTHRKPSLPYINKCHWCSSPVPANAHFCDHECRADYEKNLRIRGKNA